MSFCQQYYYHAYNDTESDFLKQFSDKKMLNNSGTNTYKLSEGVEINEKFNLLRNY